MTWHLPICFSLLASFPLLAAPGTNTSSLPRLVPAFNYFDARISLSQSVFNFKNVEKERAASESVKAAQFSYKDAREIVVLAVGNSYLQTIAAAARVETAEAQVKASRAQLALVRHQIELGELKAPVDAVVRSRLLEPGDMATPQRPVFTLALTQPKWVRVYVTEPDLGKVRPGMAARVTTDSQPAALTGKVSFIASTAEFTPKSVETEQLRTSLVYEVRILVDDGSDVLRLGQPVTVQLPVGGS